MGKPASLASAPPAPGSTATSPWLTGVLAVILFSVPFAAYVEVERARAGRTAFKLPWVDLLLWAVALVFVVQALRSAGSPLVRLRAIVRRAAAVPAACFVLVGIGALSLASGRGLAGGAAELLQLVDAYVVFWWLAATWRRGDAAPRATAGLTLALLALVAAVGVLQIATGVPNHLVRSVFSDQHALLASCFILGPVAWCASAPRGTAWRFAAHVVVAACAWLVGNLIATAVLLLTIVLASRRLRGDGARWGLELVIVTALLSVALPARHRDAGLERARSVFSVAMAERRSEVLDVKASLRPPAPAAHLGAGSVRAFVGVDVARPFARFAGQIVRTGGTDERVVPEYWTETWSALRELRAASFFGTGLGSWREVVGRSYGLLERTGTSYPSSANGYLVLGVTAGWLGLLAFWAIVAGSLGLARAGLTVTGADGERSLRIGGVAGLVGGCFAMTVHPFAVQPVAILFVFAAVLASGPDAAGRPR